MCVYVLCTFIHYFSRGINSLSFDFDQNTDISEFIGLCYIFI